MNRFIAMALLGLFTGCGEKGGDTAAGDIQPVEGPWAYENFTYESDECNYSAYFTAEAMEAIELTMSVTATGYSISSTITDEPVDCVQTGSDYSCEVTEVDDVVEWPEGSKNTGDPDAVNTTETVATGTFIDETSATFSGSIVNSCEGADCDALAAEVGAAALPCTTVISAELVYQGD